MKSFFMALCIVGLLISFSTMAQADTFTFHDYWTGSITINTNSGGPAGNSWNRFDFPKGDSEASSSYPQGNFEYNNYLADTPEYNNNVDVFKITIKGQYDNSTNPIDMYLDFDSNHNSGYSKIAGYDVPTSNKFTLVLDFIKTDLLYKASWDISNPLTLTDVGNLQNLTSDPFIDKDAFWLGFGCHFVLKSIDVDLTVSRTYNEPLPQVPEPSTILLLGMPLLGLVAWRIRKN